MACFSPLCYYCPGAARAEELPAGLRQRWGGSGTAAPLAAGPDQGAGLLWCPQGQVGVYAPDRQRWELQAGGGWLGVALAAGPEDFLRPEAPAARYQVRLGDGQLWQLPVADPEQAAFTLPHHEVLAPSGAWQTLVQERYAELAALAMEFSGALRESYCCRQPIARPQAAYRHFLALAVGVSYDLQVNEMSVLRLFDPACYQAAVHAVCDWPAQLALLQAGELAQDPARNPTPAAPATPATASGAPGGCPLTAPPAPTPGF